MVQAYWNVERLIVEYEQGGAKRAAYGGAVPEDLARRLTGVRSWVRREQLAEHAAVLPDVRPIKPIKQSGCHLTTTS
jgi:hypothetical protein